MSTAGFRSKSDSAPVKQENLFQVKTDPMVPNAVVYDDRPLVQRHRLNGKFCKQSLCDPCRHLDRRAPDAQQMDVKLEVSMKLMMDMKLKD
uniref:DET1- and DDB1-associated protein 1 n=1 Tax=Steinernema glaseri TaxID=37863 RepID=A0A1I7Z207_9BILA